MIIFVLILRRDMLKDLKCKRNVQRVQIVQRFKQKSISRTCIFNKWIWWQYISVLSQTTCNLEVVLKNVPKQLWTFWTFWTFSNFGREFPQQNIIDNHFKNCSHIWEIAETHAANEETKHECGLRQSQHPFATAHKAPLQIMENIWKRFRKTHSLCKISILVRTRANGFFSATQRNSKKI